MPEKKSEHGHLDWLRAVMFVVGAFGLTLIFWPEAYAENPRIKELVLEIQTQPAAHRKAMALRELCKIDETAARAAVIALADSDDDETALAAIRAMSREKFSGCKSALEGVVNDSTRSDALRCTALGAWMAHEKADSKSWKDVKTWVGGRASSGTAMGKLADAYSKRLWGSEVDGE